MPTPGETILTALHARLLALPATSLRGEVLPERIPAAGLLILRDGEPGEPEVTLSPLRYRYQHRAEVEAVVQGTARDAAFDTLCASVGTALAADRTLGGRCDWVEVEAPRPVDLPVEGGASMKVAVIPVILHYTTADPFLDLTHHITALRGTENPLEYSSHPTVACIASALRVPTPCRSSSTK